jgi:hypothetical protein
MEDSFAATCVDRIGMSSATVKTASLETKMNSLYNYLQKRMPPRVSPQILGFVPPRTWCTARVWVSKIISKFDLCETLQF